MKAIAFPFRILSGTVVATQTYDEVVRAHIIDALMTNQGERVMRPRYGCDIQAALFDPRDELARRDAAGTIKTRLSVFAPRVFVQNIHIELPAGTTRVDVVIVYRAAQFGSDIALRVPISASEFANRALVAPEVEI